MLALFDFPPLLFWCLHLLSKPASIDLYIYECLNDWMLEYMNAWMLGAWCLPIFVWMLLCSEVSIPSLVKKWAPKVKGLSTHQGGYYSACARCFQRLEGGGERGGLLWAVCLCSYLKTHFLLQLDTRSVPFCYFILPPMKAWKTLLANANKAAFLCLGLTAYLCLCGVCARLSMCV